MLQTPLCVWVQKGIRMCWKRPLSSMGGCQRDVKLPGSLSDVWQVQAINQYSFPVCRWRLCGGGSTLSCAVCFKARRMVWQPPFPQAKDSKPNFIAAS